ncbi:hypothetical protein KFK09_029085 [Dendrobium nobile]|uniref:EGF-like domain-containing protein n=1 Tax=Dendrobium nobile TaxID=94219 RepID=A0A8T3A9L6_DENNO|nr:hypothetical protein KFK09_029085 [Dendrobium nobile]
MGMQPPNDDGFHFRWCFSLDKEAATLRLGFVELVWEIRACKSAYLKVQALKDLHQEYKSREIQIAISNPNRKVLQTLSRAGLLMGLDRGLWKLKLTSFGDVMWSVPDWWPALWFLVCMRALTFPIILSSTVESCPNNCSSHGACHSNGICACENGRTGKDCSTAQHRAAVRKMSGAKNMHGGLGMQLEKATVVQAKIEDFVNHMSELLRIERDAELEFTQEELNDIPHPDENSDSLNPIEYLVRHGQSQQEQCDTICNLNAISSSTGVACLYSKLKFVASEMCIDGYGVGFGSHIATIQDIDCR